MKPQVNSPAFVIDSLCRGQTEIISNLLTNPACCIVRLEQAHLTISVHPKLFNFLNRNLNRAAIAQDMTFEVNHAGLEQLEHRVSA